MNLDDYKKMNSFQVYEDFIRNFFLADVDLFKFVFYPSSNPLNELDEENPYKIFEETDNGHGTVLFGRKNNTILNTCTIVVLIDFEQTSKTNYQDYRTDCIIIRTIIKGDVQKLANGLDRAFIIDKLIENNLNKANITGLGTVKKLSFGEMPLNEENSGYISLYSATNFSYDVINNKNIQSRIRGDNL